MKKWKIVLKGLINLCILLGIGGVFYLSYELGYHSFANEPLGTKAENTFTMEVKEGEGQQEVADQLVKEGLLESTVPFTFRYIFSEYRGKIQPGTYEMNESMGIEDILVMLSQVEDTK